MCYNGVSNQKNDTSNDKQMRMLRGVWVPCWRDVAGLAAPPFETRGADSVSYINGVVSWLLRGVCETARHGETQHEHTRECVANCEWRSTQLRLRKDKAECAGETLRIIAARIGPFGAIGRFGSWEDILGEFVVVKQTQVVSLQVLGNGAGKGATC